MSVVVFVKPGQYVNRFGRYLVEVLKSDGFSDVALRSLDDAPTMDIANEDVMVLTTSLPTRSQAEWLTGRVQDGARLIALRPSRLLASGLGLNALDRIVHRAYVVPDTMHPICRGLPARSLQSHVPGDCYGPSEGAGVEAGTGLPEGSVTAARLAADGDDEGRFAGVIQFPFGRGEVVVFTYDLAQAVALIRQGDPALVGHPSVGARGFYRPVDLFPGHLDSSRADTPQADIHGMLLGNAVNAIAPEPEPRWWYYPSPDLRSVVALDGDDDWSTLEQFETYFGGVEEVGGHVTVYLMLGPTRMTAMEPDLAARWKARGHSFGVHHNAFDPSYGGEEQDTVFEGLVEKDLTTFKREYGEVPLTNRNHCLGWKGYVDLARKYAGFGVRMETNVIGVRDRWLSYVNGSGRPVRHVDVDGEVIDCFQQPTTIMDDASLVSALSGNPVGEAERTLKILEEKVTRYFSPLTALSHPVSYATYSKPYMDAVWHGAREMGVPLWSMQEWAEFTLARDEACIRKAGTESGWRTWTVSGTSPRGMLTIMVPVAGTRKPRVLLDGSPCEVSAIRAFGWRYLLIGVPFENNRRTDHLIAMEV